MKKIIIILIVGLIPSISFANVGGKQVFVSCNSVDATGACASGSVSPDSIKITYTVVVTGAPSAVTLNIEGSVDKATWFTLDSSTTTTSEMRHIVNKPVMHIRANLATLTGGTAPRVRVLFISRGK